VSGGELPVTLEIRLPGDRGAPEVSVNSSVSPVAAVQSTLSTAKLVITADDAGLSVNLQVTSIVVKATVFAEGVKVNTSLLRLSSGTKFKLYSHLIGQVETAVGFVICSDTLLDAPFGGELSTCELVATGIVLPELSNRSNVKSIAAAQF